MSAAIPLPETISAKINQNKNTHPALALDKYAASHFAGGEGDLQKLVQKPTVEKVVSLSQKAPQGLNFEGLCQRRAEMLAALGAVRFVCTTTGPLTLHLARASALENAGICLHHIYGFAYLPGSGLKGMARVYAKKVWLPSVESDKSHAEKKILSVFGNEPQKKPFECGDVVFHDAWPQKWPQLILDIVNNHHPAYYNGGEQNAPGDWEDPVPVYFMAVVPGIPFSFAISPRRKDTDAELVQLAREWLIGALCYMGAGAKTNAGYGSFAPVNEPKPILPEKTRAVFETEVELVTPAFLAGASQNESDCDFRGATLRGLLRWWWRTLHAGHLNVDNLRKLEAMIWGDTDCAGVVRVELTKFGGSLPELFDFKIGSKPKPDFQREHDIQLSPPGKTAQGIFYLSYGMDDSGKKQRGQDKGKRWFLSPYNKWLVRITSRRGEIDNKIGGKLIIEAETALSQAKAALWMLCNFGGIGAKSRKGFGSLKAEIDGFDLEKCKFLAAEFRNKIVQGKSENISRSSDIERIIQKPIFTPWKDCWFALDQLGFAVQYFAQKNSHKDIKRFLGLPRNIHQRGPGQESLSIKVNNKEIKRLTSPIHFHFDKKDDGSLLIWITAFPSAVHEDQKFLEDFYKNYVSFLEKELRERTKKYQNFGQKLKKPLTLTGRMKFAGNSSPISRVLPKTGDLVTVEIVEDPKGKNRLFAKHPAFEKPGAVINPEKYQGDRSIGASVQLIVHMVSVSGKEIQFRPPN